MVIIVSKEFERLISKLFPFDKLPNGKRR